MPVRAHIVANLTARGLSRHQSHLDGVRDLARGRATLHETKAIGELDRVVSQLLDDGVDLLVLAGGDGTFMSGVSALVRAMRSRGLPLEGPNVPRIGLVPLGTVGTVARNLGERGPPLTLLDRWLAEPDRVHGIPRPTLSISATKKDGTVEHRTGFIFGTGLVARFFEVYEEGGANGIPLAGKIVARVFVGSFTGGALSKRILTPLPCELFVEGVKMPSAALSLLCASVVRDLGLGMRVCYRAAEEPERLHLVASELPPSKLGPRAPWVLAGKSIGGKNHVDRLVRSFEVRFGSEEGSPEGPYVLDGDMFRARSVVVAAGPVLPILGPRD